ncbi:hypothetical protein F4604DRAFT_1688642 [Suillus subluteus]|nr:hypothetical protein F4604DRAFT_1688642 [Suillus subluteus]
MDTALIFETVFSGWTILSAWNELTTTRIATTGNANIAVTLITHQVLESSLPNHLIRRCTIVTARLRQAARLFVMDKTGNLSTLNSILTSAASNSQSASGSSTTAVFPSRDAKLQISNAKLLRSPLTLVCICPDAKKKTNGLAPVASEVINTILNDPPYWRLLEQIVTTVKFIVDAIALHQSLLVHHTALKSLQKEHKKHLEREKALGDILTSLRVGYNPNYQDMAVLEAVRGWEALVGLPHINDVRKGDDGEADTTAEKPKTDDDVEDEGLWNAAKIEKELDQLLKTDHVTLLLEHDQLVGPASAQSLFSATSSSRLSRFSGSGAEAHPTRLRCFKLTQDEQRTANEDLLDLFKPEGFDPEGEWKKLDSLCLSKDTGDYAYEVCLFDEVKQIPNSGGSGFSLGKFSS